MSKLGNSSIFPKNIGLALGSGSSRGWAHIGVIRALAEAGIEIKYVAGTSIGSLVGAAFALNKIDVLEDFARQLDWRQILSFLDIAFPRSGLIDGEKITNFFRSQVREMNIEDLPLPYRAVATDLIAGREFVMGQGDLIAAIRASISVPGIFTLVKKDGLYLVDGGLVNPVPISVARDMGADCVIAVDLNHDLVDKKGTGGVGPADPPIKEAADQPQGPKWKMAKGLTGKLGELGTPTLSQVRQWMKRDSVPNIFDVLTTSISIMESQITAAKLAADPPELLIQPKLGHISFLEFHRAEEAIAEGYRETMAKIKEWKGVFKRP